VNNKAQVSLEYILIILAIVSLLSILMWQVFSLYSKNIEAIDNNELKKTSDRIQVICDNFYLQPKAQEIIIINNQKDWSMESTQNNLLRIKNENKEYLITCSNQINIINKTIYVKDKIIIKKENNKISITTEKS